MDRLLDEAKRLKVGRTKHIEKHVAFLGKYRIKNPTSNSSKEARIDQKFVGNIRKSQQEYRASLKRLMTQFRQQVKDVVVTYRRDIGTSSTLGAGPSQPVDQTRMKIQRNFLREQQGFDRKETLNEATLKRMFAGPQRSQPPRPLPHAYDFSRAFITPPRPATTISRLTTTPQTAPQASTSISSPSATKKKRKRKKPKAKAATSGASASTSATKKKRKRKKPKTKAVTSVASASTRATKKKRKRKKPKASSATSVASASTSASSSSTTGHKRKRKELLKATPAMPAVVDKPKSVDDDPEPSPKRRRVATSATARGPTTRSMKKKLEKILPGSGDPAFFSPAPPVPVPQAPTPTAQAPSVKASASMRPRDLPFRKRFGPTGG